MAIGMAHTQAHLRMVEAYQAHCLGQTLALRVVSLDPSVGMFVAVGLVVARWRLA